MRRSVCMMALFALLDAGCGGPPGTHQAAEPAPGVAELALTPEKSAPAHGAGRGDPVVDPASFRGQGKLAFAWNGLLYVLDGWSGTLTRLTESGYASAPAWSPDGQWLAFYHSNNPTGPGTAQVKKADGTQALTLATTGRRPRAIRLVADRTGAGTG